MAKVDAVKARIVDVVGTDWTDLAVVVAAVLSTRTLELAINHKNARTVAACLYELRVTGAIEARTVGRATGFNQVRRKPRAGDAA